MDEKISYELASSLSNIDYICAMLEDRIKTIEPHESEKIDLLKSILSDIGLILVPAASHEAH